MKKMLSIFTAISLTTVTSATVVACGEDNKKYEEFMSWIDKQESFILQISADDCPHCMSLEDTISTDKGEKILKDGIKDIEFEYAKKIGSGNSDGEIYSWTGKNLKTSLTYKKLSSPKVSEIWNEKWANDIVKWVQEEMERLVDVIMTPESGYTDIYKKYVKENFINSEGFEQQLKGTPLFLIIRDGRLVDFTSGFATIENSVDNSPSLVELVDNWKTIFTQSDHDNDVFSKLIGSGGGAPEGASFASSIDYSNINLDKYL